MALNYIFVSFFVIAFVIAFVQFIFTGDVQTFKAITEGMLKMAETAVMDIALPLTGVMTFFLGILNVGERAGIIHVIARFIGPFFNKLFPEVPKDHPANGQMIMNFSANFLGLDNAATPFGLKAMQSLQELNPSKDTASNAQIMFLVLHTSGLQIIPLSIIAQRAILGAESPSDVFIPCVVGTYVTTVVSMIITATWQKINLFNRTVMLGLGSVTAMIALILWYLSGLPKEQIETISILAGNSVLLFVVAAFLGWGMFKKVNVFEAFIEGAKGGFTTSVTIIPYLVGLLVAISAFRSCGAMDYMIDGLKWAFASTGMNTDFTDALPVALMKPLSGSGARALMIDAMKEFGPDSFVGRLVCIFQGSADTTLYIVALYFGSVGIKNTRYAIVAGLIADLIGVVAGIWLGYLFFH
ncbi:spore maturation protein SpmA [Dyadobacter sp. BE34]|uniref:Spore maturation protein SpmA n=1 Tax=Dyadobacter fermentans TaxID=94254 RepID=A0ABU1R507_9BACT|nr:MULTISPECIES: nucleoside recognition domain-containing protein [Dyadobacter]MDR6808025.1 spore maturation protein SpmA [Dyadobacter fermentans]MDR7046159.1 spore maturation protein SpmA [Dyadobacter sp. BE242]MDR7200472.1 spore maturation protein SpmA [Dyadobacter sp. BE34]MDR7218432.1 spore maturation protein SpmA [Dyadobacter sp. BE31]MDR7266363.1 spore maturation protein SpmA [Dyadobacter sp. BE32]